MANKKKPKFKKDDLLVLKKHELRTESIVLVKVVDVEKDRYICRTTDPFTDEVDNRNWSLPIKFLNKEAIKFKKVYWFWEMRSIVDGSWFMNNTRLKKAETEFFKSIAHKFKPVYSKGFRLPSKLAKKDAAKAMRLFDVV